ncbi:hypothetical protein HZB69_00475 [Candidatus Amesbacteria bacterium]|nr:hypothetical protein [Candidatus Amesbacteria bacterium]
MRRFLLVLLAFSIWQLAFGNNLVFANHKCGEVCDQYTEQGVCTHGCYSGGDPNPSFHRDTENYADNSPADRNAEIETAANQARERDAIDAAAAKQKAEASMVKVEEKINDIKTAIGAAKDDQQKIDIARGVGQCDGWANNGSEHQNSGNGCFYTCENGSWKGPSKCDGQGNGLFQYKEEAGKPSQSFLNLSPQQIADEVAKRQWEAYVQTLKQDGKQLVKDDKGEYKKNTDGYITEDIPGYVKVKTTAEIALETAGQRAAEVTIQQKMAEVEYNAKVAAANRETNQTVKNQMLAEYALLYQTVLAAQASLANLNADLVAKTRERLIKEGKSRRPKSQCIM